MRGVIPDWIKDDWSPESRLKTAHDIMAFSPRDWSIRFNKGDTPNSPDPEIWALWCLICCDTKEEAVEAWYAFCDDNTNRERISDLLIGIHLNLVL